MAVTAGSPITVDDFADELDDHESRIGSLEGNVATLDVKAQRFENLGYKTHTAGDGDQLIANNSGYFTSIKASFNTIAGRVIKTTIMGRASSATAGDVVTFALKDDDAGVVIGATDVTIPADDGLQGFSFMALTTPGAGFHTYGLYISMTNGVGPGGYIGSGAAPCWFLIEDIGEPA